MVSWYTRIRSHYKEEGIHQLHEFIQLMGSDSRLHRQDHDVLVLFVAPKYIDIAICLLLG